MISAKQGREECPLGGILPVLQMLESGKMQMQHGRVSMSRWLPWAELVTAPI